MTPLFQVTPDIFETFPGYIVGYVLARGVTRPVVVETVSSLLTDAEDRARLLYANRDLKEEPAIAVWRRVFSAGGWPASKYPASVESMLKRVARGGSLPRLHPVVDLANATSLTYLVPVGCHDLDSSRHLQVRRATSTDLFRPMGDADAEKPTPCEIVYAAGDSIRTRRWVWRQSRDALVGPDATTIFFPVDGFASVTQARVEAATAFLAGFCREHLSADVRSGLITRDNPEIV